jgi:hypothetical protein
MGQNPYHKRSVPLGEVVERIHFPGEGPKPKTLLSISPCRSGTTVLLRVFGAVGVQAHYQELKNIFRWRMQAEEFCWEFPDSSKTLYLKETLGPYTLAEARFNPLEVLLEAGMSSDDLKVFIVGRSPLETWASWAAWWREVTNVDIFLQAYQTTEAIRQQALNQGLLAATFVYDAIRDMGPNTAIQRLFSRLSVPFDSIAIQGWKTLPPFGTSGSNVILPDEPPVFDVPDLHAKVEEANSLSHFTRNLYHCEIFPEECKIICQSDVFDIYERWRLACERDLGISIQPVVI